jgi:hypothetical protein
MKLSIPSLLAAVTLAYSLAPAATIPPPITVTSTDDDGPGTLRAAIAAAGSGVTINLAVTGAIVLTNGELVIQTNLSIVGPGPALLTVQRSSDAGTPDFRVFRVEAGTNEVLISDVTVFNGRDESGGAIFNEAVLTVSNCVVLGNTATNRTGSGGKGGALHNKGVLAVLGSTIASNSAAGGPFDALGGGVNNEGTLIIADSGIEANQAEGAAGARGGGLHNRGNVTVTKSVVRANGARAESGPVGQNASGGGIFNQATTLLLDSTVSDNTAVGGEGTAGDGGLSRGGGIGSGFGTVHLMRSTISGNLAQAGDSAGGNGGSAFGGGIGCELSSVSMTNSTISGNSAIAGAGGGNSNHGGGISAELCTVTVSHSTIVSNSLSNGSTLDGAGLFNSDGTIELRNTILAANDGMVDLVNADMVGLTDSLDFNLIGTTNGPVNAMPNDQFNVSAAALGLSPLQDNGGPTFTHALLAGSIAIDAGGNPGAPATDQRGFPRIVDGVVDVGAFESSLAGAALLVLAKTCPPAAVPPGGLLVFSGTISNAGSATVTNVIIVNDRPVADAPVTNFASMDPGQAISFNGSYLVPADYAGSTITDTLTVTAFDLGASAIITTNASAACQVAQGPSITCPADIVLGTDPGLCSRSNVTWSVTTTDKMPVGSIVCVPPSGSTFGQGTNLVTCTVTDDAGKTNSCSFNVVIHDTEPPMLVGVPTDQSFQCVLELPPPAGVTATDNCSPNPTVTLVSTTNGACPILIVHTWTADDGSGNTAAASQTNTVLDTTPPVITCAGNRTVECGAMWTFDAPTATDNCDGTNVTILIVSTETNATGFCGNSFSATRTWEALDPCTNRSVCSQTITAVDMTPPTVTCPPDIMVTALSNVPPCSSSLAEFAAAGGQVSDDCSATFSYSCMESSMMSTACGEVIERTHLLVDECGNTNSCQQIITVLSSNQVTVALDCPLELLPPLALQASSVICSIMQDNEPASFMEATLSNVPPGYVLTDGPYQSWCVDYFGGLTTNAVYRPVFLHLSHGPLPPALQNPNWDRVNYILNHKQGDGFDVQAAIWHFIGGPVPEADTRFFPPSATTSNLIADAEANGAGFVPQPGQISAVIIDLGEDVQTNILEVVCAGGVTMCEGTNLTLCATVTGAGPFAFRWTKNGALIGDATNSCLTLTNLGPMDSGEYCVEATGACDASGRSCLDLQVISCRPAPPPRLQSLVRLSAHEFEVGIEGALGRSYRIEGSEDLISWRSLGVVVNLENKLRFTDPSGASKCFYRILMEP